MDLTIGTRLGPYEIVSRIGAGGMGEVFRARDTRLDRIVAIKVLPREFAGNAQLRLRLEREAKTISQLSHPNICTLHDVGHVDGIDYLVMEFLEGETLADRLARGPLPLAEVLRFGKQIAEALDRAHRAGIVHRDLKPGNIMITKSGAKLLDFGLARSSSTAVAATDATQHKPLTQEGTILGTYQYMAPEQLAGEEADARSDIFAFGVVLYEMLTGVRAFAGKTKTSLIAAILGGEPRPPSELQPLTPASLEHVIAKCLAKDRDDRWQSSADIASEIDWISRTSASGVASPVASVRITRRRIMNVALAVSLLLAAVAIAAAIQLARRLSVAEQPVRSELMPADESLVNVVAGPIMLSPDGTRLAILVGLSGSQAIAVRDLRSGETKKLLGTEGATFPFWSADGRQLGFFAGGMLKTISAAGGAVQIVCPAPQGRGGAWSERGVIVFTPDFTASIYKVAEEGGAPTAVTKAEEGWSHRNPLFLPGGKTFLFIGRRSDTTVSSIYAGSIDGKLQKRVVENASNAGFAEGRLFFVRNRNLVAQRFDTKALTVSGASAPVADQIEYFKPRDLGNFSVVGTKIVYVQTESVSMQIVAFDRKGTPTVIPASPADYHLLDVSPDGRRMAVSVGDRDLPDQDIGMIQLNGGAFSRLTFLHTGNLSAAFSPDGGRLASSSFVGGRGTKIIIHSLGSSASETIMEVPKVVFVTGWSGDGRYLIVNAQNVKTGFDIECIDLERRALVPVVHGSGEEFMPALSPNGKWVAYASAESGTSQIYLSTFLSGEGKWQVTQDGGFGPRWSRDGKQLFYVSRDRINAVDVRGGAVPEFSPPIVLPVEMKPNPLSLRRFDYVVTPDGSFITLKRAGDVRPRAVHLIANWTALLSQ